MAEQVLHRPDIVAAFEEVGGEAVAEGVAADAFAECDSRAARATAF